MFRHQLGSSTIAVVVLCTLPVLGAVSLRCGFTQVASSAAFDATTNCESDVTYTTAVTSGPSDTVGSADGWYRLTYSTSDGEEAVRKCFSDSTACDNPLTCFPTKSKPTVCPINWGTPAVVTPSSAEFRIDDVVSTTYRNCDPSCLIDGSGLTTNDLTGTHNGENNQFGFTRSGSHSADPEKYSIIFTLPSMTDLTKVYFWNWADGGGATRGVSGARFYLSTDGGATFSSTYTQINPAYSLRTAQEFDLTGQANVVKMAFTGIGESNSASGMGELRFFGRTPL